MKKLKNPNYKYLPYRDTYIHRYSRSCPVTFKLQANCTCLVLRFLFVFINIVYRILPESVEIMIWVYHAFILLIFIPVNISLLTPNEHELYF